MLDQDSMIVTKRKMMDTENTAELRKRKDLSYA